MPASDCCIIPAVTVTREQSAASGVNRTGFDTVLREHGLGALRRAVSETLQINVGKLCNQACHHCHVDAGPARREIMTAATAVRVIELLEASAALRTVDLTGGAPEVNPKFPDAGGSGAARRTRGYRPLQSDSALRPVDGMAAGHFTAPIRCGWSARCRAIRRKTSRGSAVAASSRKVSTRWQISTASVTVRAPTNSISSTTRWVRRCRHRRRELEARYREELGANFGIRFNRLLTITNMPISRFADQLNRAGQHDAYLGLLVNHFNPATVAGLMCRSLISVGYDGKLYDCDFNQMLEIPLGAAADGPPLTLWDVNDLGRFEGALIATGVHCFGCTAGAGSSCGGALAES